MTDSDPADRTEPSDAGNDIGAVARRAAAAAAERADRAVERAGEHADAGRRRIDDGGERNPGAVIGLALGAAAVAMVLTRTIFRRR